MLFQIPQRYRFSSKSQPVFLPSSAHRVVLDTTKVQIFKQITTTYRMAVRTRGLFQIPQRYRFSSKSQPILMVVAPVVGCFRYHKGTDFQANHNEKLTQKILKMVVLDTTKVQIFKQITTRQSEDWYRHRLFQIPQRYRFSSKSQLMLTLSLLTLVVLDTTKVQIFKQITTTPAV